MSEWMKNVRWHRVFVSGSIAAVCMWVIKQVEAVLTMKYYLDPANFGIWSTFMMPASPMGGPKAGPPPMGFFVMSALFTLATGITLAAIFDFMRPSFGKNYWSRVIGFTDIIVGLSIVLTFLPMLLLLKVPVILLAAWLISTFVSVFIGAMIFAKKLT